ncbi:Heparinase II/III-like protein [Amphibacillus marinus]|uniref:Heparinase II/III-like protein n=1 Tax=Amphibacillus marinus TaxID=872970 RepID=A0A1H8IPY3_9BACI|nr:heparinase II/III family protein [Amphibacillus marinus]SEN70479.1 Heparinase II/III-like protein [Amphibacillus marinus]
MALFQLTKDQRFRQQVEHVRLAYRQLPIIQDADYQTYNEFFMTGNRTHYESIYFTKRKRLTYLGILLLNQAEDLGLKAELENIIFSICHEFTWCLPAHIEKDREENAVKKGYTLDLFACETAFSLAELITLFKEQLAVPVQNMVKAVINERIIKPFLDRDHFHWERSADNWTPVCAGSIGMVALYLLAGDEQHEVIERVKTALGYYVAAFGDDGACLEGMQYWQYGFRYFTYFADMLFQQTNGKVNLFSAKKIKAIASYQQKMYLSDRHVINFADAPAQIEPAFDLAVFYNKRFPNDIQLPTGEVAIAGLVDHCGRWPQAYRQLLWKAEANQATGWQPHTTVLSDAQAFISNESRFKFACKGGHNSEPHNHNDLGHFILHYNGEPVFIDLGAGQYSQSYFSSNRYRFIQTSSQGHSVPIISGQSQRAGKKATALLKRCAEAQTVTYDLTTAYDVTDLLCYHRTFQVVPEQLRLTVTDCFHFKIGNHNIEQRFICAPLEVDENRSILKGQGFNVSFQLAEQKSDYQIEPLQYVDHFGVEQKALLLKSFTQLAGKAVTLTTTFTIEDREDV